MQIFKHSIWIARPREAVFDFFTDFSQAPRWRSYVTAIALEGSGPLAANARLRVTMQIMGETQIFDMTVLAFERPALWRHKTNETDFDGFVEYRFEPENGGTRVTMTGKARPISVYGWLAIPQLFLSRNRMYREQLPQLKRAVEGQGSSV